MGSYIVRLIVNGANDKRGNQMSYHVVESERQAISLYVITQLQRRRIVMKEGSRQVLIAKAMAAFRETNGDYPYMLQIVETEIALVTALNRASDRIIDVCESNVTMSIVERLRAYFQLQGIDLHSDSIGHYARVPFAYDVVEMRKTIKKILDNRDY